MLLAVSAQETKLKRKMIPSINTHTALNDPTLTVRAYQTNAYNIYIHARSKFP
jgi:hypothetical protein